MRVNFFGFKREEKMLAFFKDEERYSFCDNRAYLELADYLKNLK